MPGRRGHAVGGHVRPDDGARDPPNGHGHRQPPVRAAVQPAEPRDVQRVAGRTAERQPVRPQRGAQLIRRPSRRLSEFPGPVQLSFPGRGFAHHPDRDALAVPRPGFAHHPGRDSLAGPYPV